MEKERRNHIYPTIIIARLKRLVTVLSATRFPRLHSIAIFEMHGPWVHKSLSFRPVVSLSGAVFKCGRNLWPLIEGSAASMGVIRGREDGGSNAICTPHPSSPPVVHLFSVKLPRFP